MIKLKALSLREKIAQMIIVRGNRFHKEFINLGVGGIFLDGLNSKVDYRQRIEKYQAKIKIPLFVCCDCEGYRSKYGFFGPFRKFYRTKNLSEIKNKEEAASLGKEHGALLRELGFNLDFSPAIEIKNKVWPGRSFQGSYKEIQDKIKAYIEALQKKNVIATAKHYPGGSLMGDPHPKRVYYRISLEEEGIFDSAIKANTGAIMVGQAVVYGDVDSKNLPPTVSKEIIEKLREKFNGLIITDDIDMWGLKSFYFFNRKKMYLDLIKAGNDILLNTHPFFLTNPFVNYPKRVKSIIDTIELAVKSGVISEKRINESVRRILKAKSEVKL